MSLSRQFKMFMAYIFRLLVQILFFIDVFVVQMYLFMLYLLSI